MKQAIRIKSFTIKLLKALLIVILASWLLARCKGAKQTVPDLGAGGQPGYLHVFNGQTMAYYTSAGAYAFTTQAKSVFSLGESVGTTQQMPQASPAGNFYLGTSTCGAGCNYLFYFSGYSLGFLYGSEAPSRYSLTTSGTSAGGAVDPLEGYVYTADSVNKWVTVLKAGSPALALLGNSRVIAPGLASAGYLAADTQLHRVVVVENTLGSAWLFNGENGTVLGTTPSTLTLVSGSGCTSASNVGYVVVNSTLHHAYVLCSSVVIYLDIGGSGGTYLGANLAASQFTVPNITTGADLVYDSHDNTIVVSGGNYVAALNALTGAAGTSTNIASGCGVGSVTLQGLAYDVNTNTIFVADSQNSKIYLLDSTTLGFKNGTCAASSFSTLTDVPTPMRISYF